MVSGAAGQNGRLVPEHAALVRRNGPERVRTHDQQMEAKTVRELQMKLENAATEFAQVRDSTLVLLLSRSNFRNLNNSCLFFDSLCYRCSWLYCCYCGRRCRCSIFQ